MRTRPALTWLAVAFLALIAVAVPARAATTKSSKSVTATRAPVPVSIIEDPTGLRGGADSVESIRFLGDGKYQLEVQNTSDIGYLNTFEWHPPPGMTVTAITSSEGGRCQLRAGAVACTGGGRGLLPPQCTCIPGGFLTVNFTASGLEPTVSNGVVTHYGLVGSYFAITSVTPVPYHIPSFLGPGADLPVCAKGQVATRAKPCVAIG
jgi:hypothetical protein